jgi:hypothetical protein
MVGRAASAWPADFENRYDNREAAGKNQCFQAFFRDFSREEWTWDTQKP